MLSRMFATIASKNTASTRTSGRPGPRSIVDGTVAEHWPEASHGPLQQLGQVEHLEVGTQGARFDPAEVEHRADEAVETLRLGVDRLGGPADLVARPRNIGIGQVAGRGPDAGQWRAQVVRDRVEQGALERIAPARDLGAGGLPAEPIAPKPERELVGGERQEAGRLRIGWRGTSRLDGPERPVGAPAGLDRDPDEVALGRLTRTGRLRRAARGRGPSVPVRRRAYGRAW